MKTDYRIVCATLACLVTSLPIGLADAESQKRPTKILHACERAPAGSFCVSIDGELAFDGEKTLNPVINSVIPTIEIRPHGKTDQGYDWAKQTLIAFSLRADNVAHQFDRAALVFDNRSMHLSYQVPFEAQSILYPGDQWIEVAVQPPTGPAIKRRIPFAAGARTKFTAP